MLSAALRSRDQMHDHAAFAAVDRPGRGMLVHLVAAAVARLARAELVHHDHAAKASEVPPDGERRRGRQAFLGRIEDAKLSSKLS